MNNIVIKLSANNEKRPINQDAIAKQKKDKLCTIKVVHAHKTINAI